MTTFLLFSAAMIVAAPSRVVTGSPSVVDITTVLESCSSAPPASIDSASLLNASIIARRSSFGTPVVRNALARSFARYSVIETVTPVPARRKKRVEVIAWTTSTDTVLAVGRGFHSMAASGRSATEARRNARDSRTI